MCLLHCDLGLFPFQGQNKRAEEVSRKKYFCLNSPKPGPRCTFYIKIRTGKQSIQSYTLNQITHR